MESQHKYMVLVECMTFNHHAYIEDAMNGFCMQKTDFPFVCIVVDDASTDGEQEVIGKYFQEHFVLLGTEETDDYILNFGKHKVNVNCFFTVLYLKYNHYSINKSKLPYYAKCWSESKYIAYCEGDDYWTDEKKLQLQAEFLEKNVDFGMCYTAVKRYIQKEQIFLKRTYGEKIDGFEDLLKNGNRIHTLTVCVRRKIIDEYRKEISPYSLGWLMGDYPLWLYCAHESRVKFFDSVSGVNRKLEESASRSANNEKRLDFIKSSFDVIRFFVEKYNVNYKEILNDFNYTMFVEYRDFLKNKYSRDLARTLQSQYKKITPKKHMDVVYYVASYSRFLWKILVGIEYCRKHI